MTSRVRVTGLGFLLAVVLLAGCIGGGGSATEKASPTLAEGEVPNASDLRAEALAAMGNESAYSAAQNVSVHHDGPEGEQTTQINVEYAFDRANRSMEERRTIVESGVATQVDRYLLEQTLYQRSEQFVQTHGSEWLKEELDDSFDRQWHMFDQLWRYQYILGNATLSDVEAGSIDGESVYVVSADVEIEELNTAMRNAMDFPRGSGSSLEGTVTLTATFWIDTDTYRPIQVERTFTQSQTVDGEQVSVERRLVSRLTYERVTIDLPAAASDAKRLENE